jgi:hypothetical protein
MKSTTNGKAESKVYGGFFLGEDVDNDFLFTYEDADGGRRFAEEAFWVVDFPVAFEIEADLPSHACLDKFLKEVEAKG